jgi:hypothetical protein
MPDDNILRIFISYARSDGRVLALRLNDDLRSAGLAVWLDTSEVAGGANFALQIEKAIDECDVVLALLSEGSYRSEYCRQEHMRALRKGRRVIPLLVQGRADIPLYFESLNFLDFSMLERYDSALRDLLSDLTAGRAFRPQQAEPREKALSTLYKAVPAQKVSAGEKRDAGAFRRYVSELRREPWLGARYWWPYFLFLCLDMPEAADVLKMDEIVSPSYVGANSGRWDDLVRLYFRPRLPEAWHAEGVRPIAQRRGTPCSMPVYLLFDLEAILCLPDVRFSAGDPAQTKKTYAAANAFSELPFELIYHDGSVRPDQRDEIMQSRRAQVLVPDRLSLEGLQFIWCRSQAEYETLRHLVPAEVWQRWRDKVTASPDYALFHRRWAFVDDALLGDESITLRFNRAADSFGPFEARLTLTDAKEKPFFTWTETDFLTSEDLRLRLPEPAAEAYEVRFYLDDTLAYANRWQPGVDGLL